MQLNEMKGVLAAMYTDDGNHAAALRIAETLRTQLKQTKGVKLYAISSNLMQIGSIHLALENL